VREGQIKSAGFEFGELTQDPSPESSTKRRGTKVIFSPDEAIFKNFKFRNECRENAQELRLSEPGIDHRF